MSDAYSDLAKFGRFRGWVFAILFTVIGVLGLIFGIKKYQTKSIYTATVQGTVLQSTCTQHSDGKQVLFRCHNTVSYVVDGQTYQATITTDDNTEKNVGETMSIAYDPTNPQKAEEKQISNQTLGAMMVGGSLLLIAVGWLGLWLMKRFKILAAGSGAAGIFDLFRPNF